MLSEIQNVYSVHLRGEKIDLDGLSARTDKPMQGGKLAISSNHGGVCVINIEGVICQKMNLMAAVSGGCSTQIIGDLFTQAVNNPAIKGIILKVDSGGGTVAGTSELSDMIYKSRGKKPIIAFTDGMICSAAYWIASACDSIYISGDTNSIGSIGILSGHRDISGAEAKAGVKTSEVSSGKYKRITSQYEPLTAAGRAEIQNHCDYLYAGFVAAVALYRGTTSSRVAADGKVYLGKQSIQAGLTDGVSSMEKLIAQIQTGNLSTRKSSAAINPVSRSIRVMTDSAVAAFHSFTGPAKPTVLAPIEDERKKAIDSIASGGNLSTIGDLPPRQFIKSLNDRQREAEAHGGTTWN
jgi:signal peptide peptidase SppA